MDSLLVHMKPHKLVSLLVLLLAPTFLAKLPTPCQAQSKMVFAHYMLYSFLYTDDVAGFTREIALAKQHGIDGFALNTKVWDDPIYQQRADYLYQAADAAGNFKLFFSADMSGSLTLDNIITMLTRYAGYSSQLTYNGKQFISTFAGRIVSIAPYTDPLSTWRDGIFTPAGGSYYFVPFFETGGTESDISYVLNEFDSILSGLLAWGTSAWPYVNGAVSDAADQAYISSCAAAGKIYMASVSPWFYNTTSIIGNYAGDTLWRTHWQQLISLQPNLIEILTWNDWGERHYVVPIPNNSDPNTPYGVADFNDAGHPHLAYLDLAGRYFIPWYKTGQQPAIDSASKEAIYIFYYKQSKAGSTVVNSDLLDDKVYVTVLLYQPADVTITSGTQSMTFSNVPAGLQSVSMAFNTGQQSASVTRSGATILTVTGDLLIVTPGSTYDFNVYANYMTAS
eukprot:c21640_g1_i1 orf=729-2081(+)